MYNKIIRYINIVRYNNTVRHIKIIRYNNFGSSKGFCVFQSI